MQVLVGGNDAVVNDAVVRGREFWAVMLHSSSVGDGLEVLSDPRFF